MDRYGACYTLVKADGTEVIINPEEKIEGLTYIFHEEAARESFGQAT